MEMIKKLFIDSKYTNTKAIRAAVATLVLYTLGVVGLDTITAPGEEQVMSAVETIILGTVFSIGQYLVVFWAPREEKESTDVS